MTNKISVVIFDELPIKDKETFLDALEHFKPNINYTLNCKIYHNSNLISKSNFMKSLYEQLKKESKS